MRIFVGFTKNIVTFLLSIYLVCYFASLGMAKSQSPKEWNILGITFNSTVKDVATVLKANIPNIEITNLSKRFGEGPFVSNPLIYGSDAKSSNTDTGTHYDISIAYNFAPPHNVVAIHCEISYLSNAPSLKAVMTALKTKYGKPDDLDNDMSGWVVYRWLCRTSPPYNSVNFNSKDPWSDTLLNDFWKSINFTIALADGHFGSTYNIHKGCGVLLLICVNYSDGIVSSVDLKMVDSIRARKSLDYLDRYLSDGAQKEIEKEKREGDAVKPKF